MYVRRASGLRSAISEGCGLLLGLALAGSQGVTPLAAQITGVGERPFLSALSASSDHALPAPLPLSNPSAPAIGLQEGSTTSAWPALASAVVPGAGQWILGQRRWIVYLALETASVLYHLEREGRGRALRDDYRDLAWEVARVSSGTRLDGDFDYYERLSNFNASGGFDLDPVAPGVQPESDPATYNGRIWELARGLFLGGNPSPQSGDPGWDRAIAYYTERGYGDTFLWDWTGKDVERQRFRDTLRASDSAFRRATTVLGVVLGNHIVSAIDALTSSGGGLSDRVGLEVLPGPSDLHSSGSVWELAVRVRRD